MVDGVDTARGGLMPLTEREREVATLLAEGLTNAEIAARLEITFATAKWHVSQVLMKVGAERREEVAERLAAAPPQPARKMRRGWHSPFGWLPLLKGAGVAAAVAPVAGLAIAGLVMVRAGSVAGETTDAADGAALATATPSPTPTVGPTLPGPAVLGARVTPVPQPHTCDWQYGQLHFNDGALDHSGCDFSGVDFGAAMLNGADLSNTNLSGAIFRGASLSDVNFIGANLASTWFIEAIVGAYSDGAGIGPDFTDANLAGAHFTNSIVAGKFLRTICPDGTQAADNIGRTCMGTPGLRNLPTTRSTAEVMSLEGKPAPEFDLLDAATGRTVRLTEFAGRPLVLWWFASWCTRCGEAIPELLQLAIEWPDITFIAVSMDESRADALRFVGAEGIAFPVLLDSELAVAHDYGVIAGSTAVVVDARGRYAGVSVFVPWAPGLGEILQTIPHANP